MFMEVMELKTIERTNGMLVQLAMRLMCCNTGLPELRRTVHSGESANIESGVAQ